VELWWNSNTSRFIHHTDHLESVFHALDTVVGIITLAIAIIGVRVAKNAYYKFIERRNGALWDFYADFGTFLQRLKLTISKDGRPSNAAYYLIWGRMPDAEKDIREVEVLKDLARDFLHFLSTSRGQVPTTDNFDEWKEKRSELVEFLNFALYIGIRIDIVSPDLTDYEKKEGLSSKISSVLVIIDYFEKSIDVVLNKLRSEIDNSKKIKTAKSVSQT